MTSRKSWLRAVRAVVLGASTLVSAAAAAAPAHDICADLGPSLGVGVPTFSAVGDWPEVAAHEHGVRWTTEYTYWVPSDDPPADRALYMQGKVDRAKALGAIPVFSFYQLLQRGQRAGLSGSEPDVVKAALANASVMRAYFDEVVFVLQTLAKATVPVVLHVEPDSWGFMMWSMGVEGNSDATSIPVKVAASGHADLQGIADHAGGFGHALLELRDKYAPNVRMGWHASNFRVGTRPEVTADFYASVGEWDVLVTDNPHLEATPSTWWEPADPALVTENVHWFSVVSARAHLPLLMWQAPIGTTDWHFFSADRSLLTRFASAGLGGVMFDMRGSGNPDQYRAYEVAALATVPPPGSSAGGTAADMRTRLAAYSLAPLTWPEGGPCVAHGADGGPGGRTGGASADAAGDPGADPGAPPSPSAESASGCELARAGERSACGAVWTSVALFLLLAARRRSRMGGSALSIAVD